MSAKAFTKTTIDALKPDKDGKQKLYFDPELKGFGVLVSGKTNSKTYVVQRDIDGKTRRITIAAVNELPLKKARESAAELLLKMRAGIDPKAERRAKVAAERAAAERAVTLRQVIEGRVVGETKILGFFDAKPNLREKSREGYRVSLRFFEDWLDRPLREITSDMVERRHKTIAESVAARGRNKGASSANGAMRTLRALWNFAADKYADLPPHPVRLGKHKQWFKEPPRKGQVKSEHLPAFYSAMQALSNDVARDYLTLLLFTGLRKSEAASLTWDDIDLEMKMLCIPEHRAKAGRELRLPLSDVVFDMLKARREQQGDIIRGQRRLSYVFPANSAGGTIAEPRFPLEKIAAASGVIVTCHDLRRTFSTVAESCGIDGYALKALLNHSLGKDVTGNYVQMSPERLREPVQTVADRLKMLCRIEDSGNVVPMRGKDRVTV